MTPFYSEIMDHRHSRNREDDGKIILPDTPLPLQKRHETQRFSKVIVVCYRKKRDNKMMAVLKEAVVGRSMTLGLRLNSDASDKQQHEQHFCKRSLTR